ncbi:MAG: hypothetical protein GYA15_06210 [Leptolinea sp.]|jgi:D-alanyl-lipoteichoic acid acyltransferase DltB (MBOAT superfamily)|nr:hypothetical protein [Leptolinea sp.]
MRIEFLLALIPAALLIRLLAKTRGYRDLISLVSIVLIYVLQPEIPVRYLSFWLPTVTIVLIILSWLLVSREEDRNSVAAIRFMHGTGLVILLLGAFRYIDLDGITLISRPPQISMILVGLAVAGVLGLHLARLSVGKEKVAATYVAIVLIFVIFIVLKNQALTSFASQILRGGAGQSMTLSGSVDIRWFGFSYIAFRLVHTLRDFQKKRLPDVSLQTYFNYVLFFPTLSAGPIDRLEHFIKDHDSIIQKQGLTEDLLSGGKRLALGFFKKFFVADSLAIIALNSTNITQVRSAGWLWVLLYAYAFQIYFDFSGYSDIAIGLGKIMGINIPENFNHPYLKPNITQFWNNWHMTLTQWVRTYLFNPLTRSLRTSRFKNMPVLIMFIGQLATMTFIGLWHGISINFLIWGLWHGLGLFLQNRWSNRFHGIGGLITGRLSAKILRGLSIFITFNYVSIGWIWFALPNPEDSLTVLGKLFGWS